MNIKELRSIAQKGASEPYWISRYLVRPFSIYVTWLFLKLRISATVTTAISAVFALAGSIVLVPDYPNRFLISGACIFIFYLLDHVDGEIARYVNATREDPDNDSMLDISGAYFDQIIHYYQGASFYLCLGAGLAFVQSEMLWFWLGLVAALGSCGFPRFGATFNMLNTVRKGRSDRYFDYIGQYSRFNVVHFSDEKKQTRGVVLPRSLSDLVLYGRQLLGFPGNISIFIVLTVVNKFFVSDNLLLFELYLSLYGITLFVNTIYSLVKYFKILEKIPK